MSAKPPQYWFARRFPLGDMRSGMAPVHWKGWAVTALFMLGLLGAGAIGLSYARDWHAMQGVIMFVAISFFLSLGFVSIVHKTGDHIRTVADHREERSRA